MSSMTRDTENSSTNDLLIYHFAESGTQASHAHHGEENHPMAVSGAVDLWSMMPLC